MDSSLVSLEAERVVSEQLIGGYRREEIMFPSVALSHTMEALSI